VTDEERDRTLTTLQISVAKIETAMIGPDGQSGFIARHREDARALHARIGGVETTIASRCASHAQSIESNRTRAEAIAGGIEVLRDKLRRANGGRSTRSVAGWSGVVAAGVYGIAEGVRWLARM